MGRARLFACLLVLAAGLACQPDDSPGAPVVNRCAQSFECSKPDTCDDELGICAHASVERPYTAVLQVVPNNLPGSPVLRRVTLDPKLLNEGFNYNLGVIRVQRVVTVAGSVLDDKGPSVEARALEAEVAFAPSTRSYLVGGVSAFTLPDAAGVQRYSAALEPGTPYNVTVFPLAKDSELFPPASFALPATTSDLEQKFAYPPQATLSAKLLDENQKPADKGWRVRLRKKGSDQITSSVGRVQDGGVFQIRAPANMLTPSALAEQELLLEVGERGEPLLAAIAFNGERLREGGTLVMPTIPAPVLYSCTVEIAGGTPEDATIRADLTFESSFPQPAESGDVRGRDWCRLRLPGSPQGTFSCSTSLTASVGRDREVRALLLPGDYQVFVAPNGDANDRLRVATSNHQESINSQANGMQSGKAFPLSRATAFEGLVLSPQSKPMPAVTVTANALGLQRDLPPVAAYNRTAEQRSNKDGSFRLAVDVGYYDLLATPPAGSGFAWVLRDNRRIEGNGEAVPIQLRIFPQIPVVAWGTLSTPDNKPVVNARVDMFALVDNLDPEQGGQRAVRIASTASNEAGKFWLLLPQKIGEDDDFVPSMDGGVHVGLQNGDGGGRDAR